MQMSVAKLVNKFSETSFLWTSSKNAYRWNANRTGTEQHRTDTEWERNGYGTDTERETGTCVEQKQNAFGQAFPVRFLLISAV